MELKKNQVEMPRNGWSRVVPTDKIFKFLTNAYDLHSKWKYQVGLVMVDSCWYVAVEWFEKKSQFGSKVGIGMHGSLEQNS